jgi:hypothetical protein
MIEGTARQDVTVEIGHHSRCMTAFRTPRINLPVPF